MAVNNQRSGSVRKRYLILETGYLIGRPSVPFEIMKERVVSGERGDPRDLVDELEIGIQFRVSSIKFRNIFP